jgi:hypothetical protein
MGGGVRGASKHEWYGGKGASLTVDLQQRIDAFQRCIEQRDRDAAEEILDQGYTLLLVQPVRSVVPRQQWLDVLADYVVHSYAVEEQIVDELGLGAVIVELPDAPRRRDHIRHEDVIQKV